jgi:fructose/tagatose bisphosphate aldolase
MLTTLKRILADARAHHYAVPAFDCVEDVMVRAILETAESLRSPVILMGLPPDMTGHGLVYLAGLVRAVADQHPVPVTLQTVGCAGQHGAQRTGG